MILDLDMDPILRVPPKEATVRASAPLLLIFEGGKKNKSEKPTADEQSDSESNGSNITAKTIVQNISDCPNKMELYMTCMDRGIRLFFDYTL